MLALITLIIGTAAGYFYRDLRDTISELRAKVDNQPATGATYGSYGPVNENHVNQAGNTGLVVPKTPQQLEWEEQEILKKMQHEVQVKPRS